VGSNFSAFIFDVPKHWSWHIGLVWARYGGILVGLAIEKLDSWPSQKLYMSSYLQACISLLSPIIIVCVRSVKRQRCSAAGKETAGLVESNGRLHRGGRSTLSAPVNVLCNDFWLT